MAFTLLVKNSNVAGHAPLSNTLMSGELGINTYDGLIYFVQNTGSAAVVAIGPIPATANALTTSRLISLSSDATGSASFNGSANITITTTLATVNTNVGTYGSTTQIPVVTVNAKGLITAVSNTAVNVPAALGYTPLNIAGGTMSGILFLNANAVFANTSTLILAGNTVISGNVVSTGQFTTVTQPSTDSTTNVATTAFVHSISGGGGFLPTTGGNMTGPLVMSANTVINTGDNIQFLDNTGNACYFGINTQTNVLSLNITNGIGGYSNIFNVLTNSSASILNIGGVPPGYAQFEEVLIWSPLYVSSPATFGQVSITSLSALSNVSLGPTTIFSLNVSNQATFIGGIIIDYNNIPVMTISAGSYPVANAIFTANVVFAPTFTQTFYSNAVMSNTVTFSNIVTFAATSNISVLGNITFSGMTTAITPAYLDNTTNVATTAFVQNSVTNILFPVTSVFGRGNTVVMGATDISNALGYTPVSTNGSTIVGNVYINAGLAVLGNSIFGNTAYFTAASFGAMSLGTGYTFTMQTASTLLNQGSISGGTYSGSPVFTGSPSFNDGASFAANKTVSISGTMAGGTYTTPVFTSATFIQVPVLQSGLFSWYSVTTSTTFNDRLVLFNNTVTFANVVTFANTANISFAGNTTITGNTAISGNTNITGNTIFSGVTTTIFLGNVVISNVITFGANSNTIHAVGAITTFNDTVNFANTSNVSMAGNTTITGNVTSTGLFTTITQPSTDSTTNVATTAFVQSVSGSYVPIAGGTMTGALVMNAATIYNANVVVSVGEYINFMDNTSNICWMGINTTTNTFSLNTKPALAVQNRTIFSTTANSGSATLYIGGTTNINGFPNIQLPNNTIVNALTVGAIGAVINGGIYVASPGTFNGGLVVSAGLNSILQWNANALANVGTTSTFLGNAVFDNTVSFANVVSFAATSNISVLGNTTFLGNTVYNNTVTFSNVVSYSATSNISVLGNTTFSGVTTAFNSNSTFAANSLHSIGTTTTFQGNAVYTNTVTFSNVVSFSGNTTAVTAPAHDNTTNVATTAFVYGTASKVANGYTILPNGFYFQNGNGVCLAGTTVITYPVAFPTSVLSFRASANNATSVSTVAYFATNASSLTNVTVWANAAATIPFTWQAVGY